MKWFGLVLLLCVCGIFFYLNREVEMEPGKSSDVPDSTDSIREESPSVRLIGKHPFSEEYGHPDHDVKNDLKVLHFLLHDCQSIIKDFDSYFLPENREIVAFLQGKNRDRLAWIPKGYQFINEKGELVDRWGTPLFFHRESGLQFELRSAGPDRKHWTKDDVSTKKPTAK